MRWLVGAATAALAPALAAAQLAPETATAPAEKPAVTAPAQTEPAGEPGSATSAETAPPDQESGDVEAETGAPEGEADPETKPPEGGAERGDAEPGDAEAGDAEPEEAKPGAAEPAGDADPGEAEPTGSLALVPQALAESALDFGRCMGRLEVMGAEFEQGKPILEEGGACGVTNPVRVTAIAPGVALSPPAIMRCEAAAAMAEWVRRFVLPASELLPDRGRLVEVTQGTAYLCRRRNNAPDGLLSEHAYGNAIDIMGFRFASGTPILVQPRESDGTAAEAFQKTVRAAACMTFSTVLGPGEASHDDHLHLDIKLRGNGFRICPSPGS